MADHNNPQSRNEEILIATIDGKEYNKLPQSRIEELLLELKEVIEAGSGGGGGIKPIGVTTTPLYDGATTNPIQINGESYTAETGDMVTYQSTEFLFNVNEVWQELGDVSVVLAIIDDIFADIAPAFSATSTYAVGDYVIYDDQLYKCTTAHTGAWATADFTATSLSNEIENKQNALTAGKYININANNEISVNPVVPNETFKYVLQQIENYTIKVTKSVNNVVVSEETYGPPTGWDAPVEATLDEAIHIYIHMTGTMFYDLLTASDTHEAGFKQTMSWFGRDTFTENFSTVDHSGEKLITKSEMDTALSDKQGVLIAGNHIAINNDEISVNRWAVPAGKVVYTVITSNENYGQNVHVQRHTVDGGFIDDRTFTCVSYKTVNIDDLISIRNPYSSFNITLLEDSDEQQSGYSYTVNPITTPTSNSFTFTLPQEENDNDLIIRSELNAVSEKLPAVPSTDGTYVLTATVTNGEVVYSWESNNGLTQAQINALIALLD